MISADLGCCDAFHLMSKMERTVDVTITDPPYDDRTCAGQRSHGATRSNIDFAALPHGDIDRLVSELLRVTDRWVIIFCSFEMLGRYRDAAGDAWVRSGVWDKLDGAPQFTGDRPAQPGEALAIMHRSGKRLAWNGGGKRAIWRCGVERCDRVHPTQKPLALMRDLLLDFSNIGDMIFDPFAGSGSTGVACLQLRRSFMGSEVDPEHYRNASDRLLAAAAGVSLHEHKLHVVPLYGGKQ